MTIPYPVSADHGQLSADQQGTVSEQAVRLAHAVDETIPIALLLDVMGTRNDR